MWKRSLLPSIFIILNIIVLVIAMLHQFWFSPIKSETLRKDILSELGLEELEGDKTRPNRDDLKRLTSLSSSGNGVSTLSGLQHATELEEITIHLHEIDNLKPIRNLELHSLDLSHREDGYYSFVKTADKRITDITPLQNMTSLKELYLSGEKVEDFSAFTHLQQLEVLHLANNDLEKTPKELGSLVNLEKLKLNNNRLQDIQSLENLEALEELDLERNMIDDFSELEQLTSLQTLHMENNSEDLNNLLFMTGLENLTELKIIIPEGVDAEPISNLESLQHLVILDSHIGPIDFLAPLEKLTSLQIIDSHATSLEGIESLNQLNLLNMPHNEIESLEPLRNLTALDSITLKDNNIDDISALSKLKNLTRLDIGRNRITDIDVLKNTPKITSLNIANNNIENIDVLGDLPELESLWIEDNVYKDVKALRNTEKIRKQFSN